MKLPGFSTSDRELTRFSSIIRRVLSALSVDNFQTYEFTGTTSSSSNGSQKFRHGLNSAPRMWLALEGDVYVPIGGLGTLEIDVRSTKTSEQFRILLIR